MLDLAVPDTSDMWAQVKQVAAGGMHSVVLLTSGKVFTAGVNDEGPLGRPTGHPLLAWFCPSSVHGCLRCMHAAKVGLMPRGCQLEHLAASTHGKSDSQGSQGRVLEVVVLTAAESQ